MKMPVFFLILSSALPLLGHIPQQNSVLAYNRAINKPDTVSAKIAVDFRKSRVLFCNLSKNAKNYQSFGLSRSKANS